jgi:hypothetical protein
LDQAVTDRTAPPSDPEGWLLHEHSWHLHRRLWERAGIVLEFGEYAALCRAIRQGRADKVRADGKRSGYHAVPFRGGTSLAFRGGGLPRTALAVRPAPATSSRPTRTRSPGQSPAHGAERAGNGYRFDRIGSRLRVMEDTIGRSL